MIKDLTADSPVTLKALDKNEHKTQPPPRFSETKLISELEKRGIGRPATFSTIISVIQERNYVKKVKGQQLAPTFLGFAIVKLLLSKFPEYIDYEYTAKMEEALEEVANGKITREQFLDNFWNGNKGFQKTVENILKNIDWDEVKEITTLDLNNGYSVTFNKFGTFLQDNNGTKDEKGYLPSVKIDDESLAEDYLDTEVCKEIFEKSKNRVEARVLGELKTGEYKGWIVTAKDGKFGSFVQATNPKDDKVKPVNHPIPEDKDLVTVKLEDVESLFAEVKLPRWSNDKKWFVGIGKKGNYMAYKSSVKARPKFKSLSDDINPRTVSFDVVKKLWDES